MIQVVKRDGENAEFSLNKITEAIKKAFKATKKDYNNEILELLSLRVTADFQDKMKEGMISVEEIQDSVEHVLEQTGYTDVAKAYILYRKQREKIRNMNSTILDYKDVVNSYVKVEDWRVKENSTVTYSVGGLILSNSGAVTANYWLSEIYDHEIAEAHRNADIHLHDLSMLTGYCAGWSLKQLITARKVSCTLTIENAVNGKQTAFQLPRFLFVTCMNHRYEGGGFMFCPPATDNDGILDLCCVGNISKVLVLLALPTAFFGKHYFVKGIDAYTATQMSITASAPLWVHTDGEVTRKSCGFRVECLPGAIRMITPEVK